MTTLTASRSSDIRELLSRIGARLSAGFESYLRMRGRVAIIEALAAKSDRELADLGIRRDQIPQYVFRDLMY